MTGTVSIQGSAASGRTDMGGDTIEIGSGRTADGVVFIDFHTAEATYSDYTSRILRTSGANGTLAFYNRGTGEMQFINQEAGGMVWYTSGTERMRMGTAGGIIIGGSGAAPAGQLVVPQNSTAAVLIGGNTNWSGSSGVLKVTGQSGLYAPIGTTFGASVATDNHWEIVNGNGQVGAVRTSGSTTTYNSLSDYRTKTNVQPLSNALVIISQLKPVRFNFKTDLNKDIEGFIAHELQECAPNAVTGEKDAVFADGSINPQCIDMSFLVPFLVAGMQDLVSENTALKTQLSAMDARLAALEAKLNSQ
jgi:hypothetical protein